jgi:HEPN domain-containing protein
MRKYRESSLPEDWFGKGALDIRRSEILLENSDPGGAAFHLQQALEKHLKGYLIQRGWKLERVHDLEDLLDHAIDHNGQLEAFRPLCQEVTEYYIEERYPFSVSSNLTVDEVRSKLSQAKQFVTQLREVPFTPDEG